MTLVKIKCHEETFARHYRGLMETGRLRHGKLRRENGWMQELRRHCEGFKKIERDDNAWTILKRHFLYSVN